jgi:preprotein translocase subunit YajC
MTATDLFGSILLLSFVLSGMFLLKQQHKQQQKHQDSTNISTVTPKNKPSISRRQTN